MQTTIKALLQGAWLGLLNKDELNQITGNLYEWAKFYRWDGYLKQGLFPWESEAIKTFFKNDKKILLLAAGAGREVIGLSKLGYDVDAYECNKKLLERGNQILRQEGIPGKIEYLAPSACPNSSEMYDGIIVGWWAYGHIYGMASRLDFLKMLRKRLKRSAPLLLSFPVRKNDDYTFSLISKTANVVKWLFRKETETTIGDGVFNMYTHRFTAAEIGDELKNAGFQLQHFGVVTTSELHEGYAIGIAN